MGAVKLLTRGAKAARPLVEAVRSADSASVEGGHLAVLPGDPPMTARLRSLLGDPAAMPAEDALAVVALRPDTPVEEVVPALVRRERAGGRALAVLVGTKSERAEMERALRERGLEVSRMAHVASLEGPGARAAQAAVARALGDDAVAAGRRNPALRPAVGRQLVEGAAKRAGAIGALPLWGADFPALALIQVRLVAELAALHDRPFGAERALEAVAVVGAGLGWRALGRSAVGVVPGVGWAVRGGLAYASTRALGEAALRRLASGHDLIEAGPLEAVKPKLDRVLSRFGRGSEPES